MFPTPHSTPGRATDDGEVDPTAGTARDWANDDDIIDHAEVGDPFPSGTTCA